MTVIRYYNETMGIEDGNIQDCIDPQEESSEGLLDNLLDEELAIFKSSGFGIEKNSDGVEEYVTYIKDTRIAIPGETISFGSLIETSDHVLKILMIEMFRDPDISNKYGERTPYFVDWYVSASKSKNYDRIQQSESILSEKFPSENTFDAMNELAEIQEIIGKEELIEKGLINIQPEEIMQDFSKFGIEGLLYGAFEGMPFDERKEKYLESQFEKGKIEICETIQEDLQELSYELSDINEDIETENPDFAKWLDLNNFKQDIGKNVFVSPDGEIVLSFSHNIVTGIKTPIGGQNVDIPQFIKHYDRNGYRSH